MKRTFTYILIALAACAIFAGLVHVVLVTAQLSKPATTTIYGPTTRRIWATTAAMLALVSVIIGVRTFRQPTVRMNPRKTKIRIFVAMLLGLIALVNAGAEFGKCQRWSRLWKWSSRSSSGFGTRANRHGSRSVGFCTIQTEY